MKRLFKVLWPFEGVGLPKMGCNIPDYVLSPWDIAKVTVVDFSMVLSLAGNIAMYVCLSRRQTKLSPAEIILRFIFGFGIGFAGFSIVSFTLATFCGRKTQFFISIGV